MWFCYREIKLCGTREELFKPHLEWEYNKKSGRGHQEHNKAPNLLLDPFHPDVLSKVFFLPPTSHPVSFSALYILSHMPVISRRCPLCVQMSNSLKRKKVVSQSKNADSRALLTEMLFLLQTCHAHVRLILSSDSSPHTVCVALWCGVCCFSLMMMVCSLVLQLRYQHGLATPDLQQTLPNLKNFLEHGLMVRW